MFYLTEGLDLQRAFVHATLKFFKERGQKMFLLFSHKPLVAQGYMHVLKLFKVVLMTHLRTYILFFYFLRLKLYSLSLAEQCSKMQVFVGNCWRLFYAQPLYVEVFVFFLPRLDCWILGKRTEPLAECVLALTSLTWSQTIWLNPLICAVFYA